MKYDPRGSVRLHELPGVDKGMLCRIAEIDDPAKADFTFFGRRRIAVKSSAVLDANDLRVFWKLVRACLPQPPFNVGVRTHADIAIRLYSSGDPVGSVLIGWEWDDVKIDLYDYGAAIGFDGESPGALILRSKIDELLPSMEDVD